MQPRPFSLTGLSQKARRLLPWLAVAGLFFYNLAFLRYSPSFLNGPGLGDFGSFVASGLAVQAGENPYAIYPLTSKAEHQGEVVYFPNMNPPVSLLVFEFLALYDPVFSVRIWTLLSIFFYLIGLIFLNQHYRLAPIWFSWALVLAGFWDTLALGQIYTFLFAILVAAWLCLTSRREVAAGILIGMLVAIKPNLVVWPILLFVAGFRRPAVWAFATSLGLSILPVFRYGTQVYQQWLEAVMQASWISMPHYLSLFGVTARFGVPWLGLPLALLLLVVVAWWAWRKRPEILYASAVALVASILASPLATPRFTLFLVPVIFMHNRGSWRKFPGLVFALPTSLVIWLGFQSEPLKLLVGLPYFFALLILLWSGLNRSADKKGQLSEPA